MARLRSEGFSETCGQVGWVRSRGTCIGRGVWGRPGRRAWVLGKTKFARDAPVARILDREMLAKRSANAASWWRSHYSEKCRCDGCSGRETDLLAIFEGPPAFVSHVMWESKIRQIG